MRLKSSSLVPVLALALSFLAGAAVTYRAPQETTPAYVDTTYDGVTEVTYLVLPDGHLPTP